MKGALQLPHKRSTPIWVRRSRPFDPAKHYADEIALIPPARKELETATQMLKERFLPATLRSPAPISSLMAR
jgi:hypothetical protein